jgi:hypothetical protein
LIVNVGGAGDTGRPVVCHPQVLHGTNSMRGLCYMSGQRCLVFFCDLGVSVSE